MLTPTNRNTNPTYKNAINGLVDFELGFILGKLNPRIVDFVKSAAKYIAVTFQKIMRETQIHPAD